MAPLMNTFTVALYAIALAIPSISFAAADPQGRDFVVALNPESGSAYRSAMIWYLKGIADQREISEAVTARMSKPTLPATEWTKCRNSLAPEALATKVAQKIVELELEQEPLAWAVTTAVGAACDPLLDKLLKSRTN